MLKLYAVSTLIGALVIASLMAATASFGSCMTSTGRCSEISLPGRVLWAGLEINVILGIPIYILAAIQAYIVYSANPHKPSNQANNREQYG